MAEETFARSILRWTLQAVAAMATLALLMVALFAIINWRDEPLLPEARAVIDGTNLKAPAPADNLFFNLLGFSSAESDNINAEGQRLFALYQKATAPKPGDPDAFDIYKRAGIRKIQFSGDRLALCNFKLDEKPLLCIADAHQKRGDWQKLITDNATFLDRYRKLPESPQYLNLLPPDPFAPLLSWVDVFDGKRLLITSLAIQIESGDLAGATDALVHDIKLWRSILGLRNLMLIDKMVSVAQLRIDLTLASELLRTQSLDSSRYDLLEKELSPLTKDERSMRGPIEGELRFAAATIDKAQHAWDGMRVPGERGLSDRALSFLGDLGYQRNATLNLFYQRHKSIMAASETACTGFQAFKDHSDQGLDFSFKDYWVNPSGKVLATISIPAYANYVGRMCDMDGQLKLVALQLSIRRLKLTDEQIPAYIQSTGSQFANPYTGQAMQWNPEKHGLSFQATDERNRAMMPWPI